MMAMPRAGAPAVLPPHVWLACGGPSARAPQVGSLVYYFPEGHLEQCLSVPSDLPLTNLHRPFFLCAVTSVQLLADPDSDEVYSVISLDPTASSLLPFDGNDSSTSPTQTPINPPSSFSKILTRSDANNGGGFSIPRFCADSILPPLDLGRQPPVQTLTMRDVHGKIFEFKHIYRGTPRRHLLTTGWARFVNDKKLVAGDIVVFIRNGCDLLIGIRRGPQYARSQVAADEVLDVVQAAAAGRSFQVMYHPNMGNSTGLFVVEKVAVEQALMSGCWLPGVRVKLAIEADNSVRTAMYQGTVSKVLSKPYPWVGSPWRALQVTWDEPEVLKLVRYVNPWHVKVVLPTAPLGTIQTSYTTLLKWASASCNIYQNSTEISELTSPTPPLHFSQASITSPSYNKYQHSTKRFKPEPIVPFMVNHCTILPAGMQGARQNHQHLPLLCTPGSFIPLTLNRVLPDNPLEGSSETGTEQSRSSEKNVATGTLMLFGKLIEFEQDSDDGANEAGHEIFLPDLTEEKLEVGIGTHTRFFTDLVLRSKGL